MRGGRVLRAQRVFITINRRALAGNLAMREQTRVAR